MNESLKTQQAQARQKFELRLDQWIYDNEKVSDHQEDILSLLDTIVADAFEAGRKECIRKLLEGGNSNLYTGTPYDIIAFDNADRHLSKKYEKLLKPVINSLSSAKDE